MVLGGRRTVVRLPAVTVAVDQLDLHRGILIERHGRHVEVQSLALHEDLGFAGDQAFLKQDLSHARGRAGLVLVLEAPAALLPAGLAGTRATRREFDNALVSDGADTLAKFLGRQNSVGLWQILLNNFGEPFPCGPLAGCFIVEPSDSGTGANVFKTLQVSVPTPGALKLSGTAIAATDSLIGVVSTLVVRCPNTNSPSSPCSFVTPMFTNAGLSPQVSVTAGQSIQVTVVISFS